jgi:hypothetical protein
LIGPFANRDNCLPVELWIEKEKPASLSAGGSQRPS